MNSFISISEPERWRRSLRRYAALCLVVALALGGSLVVIDPYDTGRFSLFGNHRVANFGPFLTAASLARQPEVEAALLGNSTFDVVDPARLTSLTDLRFVSLAMHGAGPLEQLAVAHWLFRQRQGNEGTALKALVIGLDGSWCRGDGQLEPYYPFPFWLYSDSRLVYVSHLVNLKAFEAAARKIKMLLGVEAPFRADGYRNYDAERIWKAAAAASDFALGTTGFDATGPANFSAAHRLRQFLSEVPEQTAIVLLFVPRHHSSLLSPGTEAALRQERCKQAFRDVVAGRPHSIVADMLTDSPMVREDENFWDRIHYRAPVARAVEDVISDALHGLTVPSRQHAAESR